MPVTINGNGSITGLSVGGLGSGVVNTASIADGAVTTDKASGSVKGIEMVDQWRITSTKSNSGQSVFDSNWERNDLNSNKIGSAGMSESSGVFTFPTTGKYLVIAFGYATGNNDRYMGIWIERTVDGGSNWTRGAEGYGSAYNSGNSTFSQVSIQYFFHVTNTSTHKIRLKSDNVGTCNWDGAQNIMRTGFTFIRMGDA
jgi:hypothetical protein